MEQLQPGDPLHIGAYRLLARLGAGGMGQVYLARSDRGRTVALRLVREELAGAGAFRDRFRLEVQAARRVTGPWTAPVLDADTEAPAPWTVTGYVAGPSLRSVVSGTHGPLPGRSVRILGSGLAHALAGIHAAGLIHRALKPSNVLLTVDGPRVIGFGIARPPVTAAGGGPAGTGASAGRPMLAPGRPGLMAPEQIRGDRATPACDVFCLGAVLAYAAAGALPSGAAGSVAHAPTSRVAQGPPDLGGLPESLRDLVAGCLREDPGARPTLAQILERTDEPAADGPWLPGPLMAHLGRHAAQLRELEGLGPERPGPEKPGPEPVRSPAQAPARPASPERGRCDTPCDTPRGAARTTASPPASAVPPSTPPPSTPPPSTPPPDTSPAYGCPRTPSPEDPPPPPRSGYHYYAPVPEPEPVHRNSRWTAALVMVALIVAVGAGGSVYAVMEKGGAPKDPAPHSTTGPTAPAGHSAPGSPGPGNR